MLQRNMANKIIHHCLCYTIIAFALTGADYCSNDNYSTLEDIAKRSPTYSQDAVALCDRYLTPGWYSAKFHEIPTTAPRLSACGTTYPYWMNDIAPANIGVPKSVQMCQVGFSSNCVRSHYIRMVNCGSFFVYELSPLDICNSAYCFEQSDSCVADVPQNIEVRYHSVSWTTIEQTQPIRQTVHDPDVNLECHFDRLSDLSLYYDVTWYVDNTEVLTNQTVSSNSSDIPLLSGTQMLAREKKANSMIHCVVGAKLRAEDSTCNVSSSPLFFAGIKVLTSTLHIPRGRDGEVEFQFTIPFISKHYIREQFEGQTALYINTAVHGESRDCDDPNKNLCDVTVSAYGRNESHKYDTNAWKVKHKFKVYNRDNGDFTLIDKHLTLRLQTGTTSDGGSKIFENLTLSDVQVF
ncbi:von Willebrand factor D and EGF domain-containing protein-like [Crassostrea virginica]